MFFTHHHHDNDRHLYLHTVILICGIISVHKYLLPVEGSNSKEQELLEKSCVKTVQGLGRNAKVTSLFVLWLVNFDRLRQHLHQSLIFVRAESKKHGERLKPSYTAPDFDVWHFENLTLRNGFLKVSKIGTGSPPVFAHRFSLVCTTDREPGTG